MANRRIKRTKSFSSYIQSVESQLAALRSKGYSSTGIAPGAISADNMAQEVTLTTNVIKSSDFIPGVIGWQISSSGVAEFSNVYVRGDINAETGTIGYWNISSPGVERTIGGKKLFGTFLESADLGANDDSVDSGVYVGMFKSYREDAIPVTGASRTNNIVTITAVNHGYLNGDYVIVELDNDTTTQYGTGSVPAQIIEVSKDTFKYVSYGSDTSFLDENEDVASTLVTGTSTLYNKDVAGLYLQDYGKKVFDYGYFSNEGVSYVSAETYNLVHNPSFEYDNSGNTTPSNVAWSLANTSATTMNVVAYSSGTSPIDGLYRAGSTYGLKVDWTSTPSNGQLSVTTNYSLVDGLVSDDATLYLQMDIYSTPYHQASSVHVSGYTPNTSTVVVTTDAPHGLSTGDYIYESFLVPASSDSIVTTPGGDSYVMKVANVVSNTVFWIDNVFGAPPIYQDGTDQDAYVVSKITVPEFKLTDIYFDFGNSSPLVSISAVATDAWLAQVAANQYSGKLSLTENDINASIINDHDNNQLLVKDAAPLGIVHRPTNSKAHRLDESFVPISLAKLYSKYRQSNPTGLEAKSPFKIVFPTKVYSLVGGAALSAGSYVIDNISLSTEKRFFYADSASTSYSWYSSADKPNTASVQNTKQWLGIDLINQTASYKYTDVLEFKSPAFSNDLVVNSGIYTVNNLENEEVVWQGLHQDSTSSDLFISSGAYSKTANMYANADVTMQSYSYGRVSSTHTSYQISSDLHYSNATDGTYLSTHSASLALDAYEDILTDGTKRDRGAQAWLSADNIIFSNRNSVVGSDKSLKFSVFGNTEINGNLSVLTGVVSVPGVTSSSPDSYASTVKFVKDNRQVYYLPTGSLSEATYANSKKIYVSSTQPSSGTLGDIWIKI